jgi:Peptide N-acetyl-beta-D-glucosaminyl asparaginase amidase A
MLRSQRFTFVLASACSLTIAGCHGNLAGIPSTGSPVSESLSVNARIAALAGKPAERTMPFRVLGSSNTITADMPVPRPNTKPCVVTLFEHRAFKNFSNQTYSYKPPTACPGPWAKVVFNFDVRVTRGIQFDRTGIIWLDGAVLYFGSTAEPSPNLAPHWHVERDATDLAALFTQASTGQIELWNCYCPPDYTGIQYGNAYVQFYPPNKQYPAPKVPDEVIGIPFSPPLGSVATLPQNTMQIQTTLPRNIVRAYLDLYLQSQNDEEQYFMCVPNTIWKKSQKALGFCQNTAFREGQVSVDGMPAGLAPIYPWIFTGGIDPNLWFPIPGVQTLEFVPYRVDLTPFAAALSNGSTQTVAVNVFRAYNYFSGAGDLLLFRDPKAATVGGKLTQDTLSATPDLSLVDRVAFTSGTGLFGGPTAKGTVTTRSKSAYTIAGYVDSSIGRTRTTVSQTGSFINAQTFSYSPTYYVQTMGQDTRVATRTTTTGGSGSSVTSATYDYPVAVSYPFLQTAKGFRLPVKVYQGYEVGISTTGARTFASETTNTVESKDTMLFNKKGDWIGVRNGASSQLYTYKDPSICYGKSIASLNNAVTAIGEPGCSAQAPPPPER